MKVDKIMGVRSPEQIMQSAVAIENLPFCRPKNEDQPSTSRAATHKATTAEDRLEAAILGVMHQAVQSVTETGSSRTALVTSIGDAKLPGILFIIIVVIVGGRKPLVAESVHTTIANQLVAEFRQATIADPRCESPVVLKVIQRTSARTTPCAQTSPVFGAVQHPLPLAPVRGSLTSGKPIVAPSSSGQLTPGHSQVVLKNGVSSRQVTMIVFILDLATAKSHRSNTDRHRGQFLSVIANSQRGDALCGGHNSQPADWSVYPAAGIDSRITRSFDHHQRSDQRASVSRDSAVFPPVVWRSRSTTTAGPERLQSPQRRHVQGQDRSRHGQVFLKVVFASKLMKCMQCVPDSHPAPQPPVFSSRTTPLRTRRRTRRSCDASPCWPPSSSSSNSRRPWRRSTARRRCWARWAPPTTARLPWHRSRWAGAGPRPRPDPRPTPPRCWPPRHARPSSSSSAARRRSTWRRRSCVSFFMISPRD